MADQLRSTSLKHIRELSHSLGLDREIASGVC